MAFILEGVSFEDTPEQGVGPILKGVSFEDTPFAVFQNLRGVSFEDPVVQGVGPVLKGVSFEDLLCFETPILDMTVFNYPDTIYCNLRDICLPLDEGIIVGSVLFKEIQLKAGGFKGGLSPLFNPNCSDEYNLVKCSGDGEYFNNYVVGDTLSFQFQFNDLLNAIEPAGLQYGWKDGVAVDWLLEGEIIDYCNPANTVPLEDHTLKAYVGIKRIANFGGGFTYEPIQALQINTTSIPFTCWQIKIRKFDNLAQTQFEERCSEAFKVIDCEDTVLISSSYTNKDTFGNCYTEPFEVAPTGTSFVYSNAWRLRAYLDATGFVFDREVINNTTREVSSQQCEDFLLRTLGLPEYVARILGNILNGPDITIDGVVYQLQGNVDKDNDLGKQWYPEIRLQRCNETSNFDCE